MGPLLSGYLGMVDLPLIDTGIDSPMPEQAILLLVLIYGVAAWFNTRIPPD